MAQTGLAPCLGKPYLFAHGPESKHNQAKKEHFGGLPERNRLDFSTPARSSSALRIHRQTAGPWQVFGTASTEFLRVIALAALMRWTGETRAGI
jgi:hypothetical protein